jgi:hypothetical protein
LKASQTHLSIRSRFQFSPDNSMEKVKSSGIDFMKPFRPKFADKKSSKFVNKTFYGFKIPQNQRLFYCTYTHTEEFLFIHIFYLYKSHDP